MDEGCAREVVGADAFERFCAEALPEVYGYLCSRCRDERVAEDLTSETFAAAVSAFRRELVAEWSMGWLIVVARRRLIDYWRRRSREERRVWFPTGGEMASAAEAWPVPLVVERALEAMERLAPDHRAVLTLRYLDGLSVAEVSCEIGRGVHATEAFLGRARRALRRSYEEVLADD
jgi:RNA polymerase sigma-70 factor (ECF subfamily)